MKKTKDVTARSIPKGPGNNPDPSFLVPDDIPWEYLMGGGANG